MEEFKHGWKPLLATTIDTWLMAARHPDVVKRSIRVAALVGTILVLINQGNVIFGGPLTLDLC